MYGKGNLQVRALDGVDVGIAARRFSAISCSPGPGARTRSIVIDTDNGDVTARYGT